MERKLKLGLWSADARVVTGDIVDLEKRLSAIGEISIAKLQNLDDAGNYDVVMMIASIIPEDEFSGWIKKLIKKFQDGQKIWTPAIVFSKVSADVQTELMELAFLENWYFDVVHPEHLDSLPVRMSNLLRIHDHLKEMDTYQKRVEAMELQLEALSAEVEKLRPDG